MLWAVLSNFLRVFQATLNYIEQFLILASTVTGCISISGFCYKIYKNL